MFALSLRLGSEKMVFLVKANHMRQFLGQLIVEIQLDAERVAAACRLVGQSHRWRGGAYRIPTEAWHLFFRALLEELQEGVSEDEKMEPWAGSTSWEQSF